MSRKQAPEVILTVTEDHFKRAVPGDQCHCTIGEAVHDALPAIMTPLGLTSVDAATIAVNPAEAAGEPCVGVSFAAWTQDKTPVNVRFLLQEASAFKVAYTTDNRATGAMRRTAARRPYVLKATELSVRKSRAGQVTDGGRAKFTPEGHVKALATYAARSEGTVEEAQARVLAKLAAKQDSKSLPYKLTPSLKKLAKTATAESFAAKGTNTPRLPAVRVYKNRRFHA